jgi:hypothetical protein
VKVIAEIDPGYRAESGLFIPRISNHRLAQFAGEQVREFFDDCFLDDEPLRGNARLATVDKARCGAGCGRFTQVRVGEHQVGVRTPQLEHRLLQEASGLLGNRSPGRIRTGQGRCHHTRMLEHLFDPRGGEDQGPEQSVWKASLCEDAIDLEGASGDVGGMLQNASVSCHEGRCGEAEHLPEGKVPGHDGEDDPEGTVRHITLGAVGLDLDVGEDRFGVLGVVAAGPGAFVDLCTTLANRFAHLVCH